MPEDKQREMRHFEVRDGRRTAYAYRRELAAMGYRYVRDGNKWAKDVPEGDVRGELKRMRRFCRKGKLRLREFTDGQIRSGTYRAEFFRENPPFIRDRYVCAYCMRLIRRKDVTVDHIIPVHAVQTDAKAKRMMRRAGLSDINDVRNLAPACRKCNTRKSAKLGSWVYRGKLGRQKWFICLCLGLKLAAGVLVAVVAGAGIFMYLQM